MFPFNFTTKDIPVGRGSIVGRNNIEEFFNHVSTIENFEDRHLVDLAPTYEIAAAHLVRLLETKFVNLNPIIQHMFLTLGDMEEGEKKDFVLETLLREFGGLAREARKVFAKFNMLGSHTNFVSLLEKMDMDRIRYTNIDDGGEIKAPIPCKLLAMNDALENNYAWLVPENLFDESSTPKTNEKGDAKTYVSNILCLVEKTPHPAENAPPFDNT
jgi:hypothetical protein